MTESYFLNKFFEVSEMNGQPNLHYLYPSNAYKLIQLEKYREHSNNAVNFKKLKSILDTFTQKSEMPFPDNFIYLHSGRAIHSYIQSRNNILDEYFVEYQLKTQFKCLTVSGRIDLITKNYEDVVEIKTSKYNSALRDYYILQMQIYDYVYSKIYNRRLKNLIVVVISNKEISEYKIKSNFERVEEILNYYIDCVHVYEKIKTCQKAVIQKDLYKKGLSDFNIYVKENGIDVK